MTKTAIALSFVLALGAVSTASAEYDPWIMPDYNFVSTVDTGLHAFASTEAPRPDPRFDDVMGGAIW